VRRLRIPRLLVAVALLALLAVPVAFGAIAPQPGQRIDLKVLLIGASGTEPTFGAWKAQFDREGVPYDTIIADNADGTITDARLADYNANYAKYQAVILATGNVVRSTAPFPSALNPDEWAALDRFERTFGIRRLSDNTDTSLSSPQAHGLNFPIAFGDQGGNTATLTADGRAIFPYLQGTVPIEVGAFGSQATPAFASPVFQPLLTLPNGASYLGIYNKPDGREEMVMTVDSNQFMSHAQLLRHGMLNWVTRGYYLGTQRNYFEMHVDDVFLPNDRWDTTRNQTGVEGDGTAPGTGSDPTEYQCTREPADPANPSTLPQCPELIRMTPQEVADTIAWQNQNGIVLDMVFNGGGADEQRALNGGVDLLEDAFLANKGSFRWINHTFTHPNLNTAPQSVIEDEIRRNQQWANARAIPYDPSELVTGEHSAVGNSSTTIPNPIPQNAALAPALTATGINSIASDNSREQNGAQRPIGPSLTVPRYPSNIYYNVSTMAEQLDEYNYIYVRPGAVPGETTGCVDIPNVTTCRTTLATEADYIASETNIMFGHLMGNDPRPHYVHQSNLTGTPGNKILFKVLDPLLARYRQAFAANAPLVQLTQKEIALELQRQALWKTARDGGQVSAYLLDGQIHIQNRSSASVQVPATGLTGIGSEYAGSRSGWATVAPTSEITRPAPAAGQPVSRGGASNPQAGKPKPQAGKPKSAVRKLRLSKLTMRPKSFSRRGKSGSTITWSANRSAKLSLAIEKAAKGKKVGASCRPPSKRLKKRKPCVRYLPAARISRKVAAGNGRLKITAKIGKRTLRRGSYRLRAVLTDGKGNHSPMRVVKFTVKR
jgi:hypothetical protein